MTDTTPMNEELQSKLAAILGSLSEQVQSATDAGVDFAKEQLPIVAQEVVRWGIAESAVWAAFWAIPPIVFLFLFRRGWRLAAKHADESDGISIFLAVVATVALTAPSIGVVCNVATLTKCIVAPRVYLIEWCADRLR